MDSFSDDDEECQFFDAHDNSEVHDNNSISLEYELWVKSPESVGERRRNFFKWMDLTSDKAQEEDLVNADVINKDIHRISGNSGAVLRSAIYVEEFSSSRSSLSSWSTDHMDSPKELDSSSSFECRNGNLDDGNVCTLDSNRVKVLEKVKKRWLSKLRSISCVTNDPKVEDSLRIINSKPVQKTRVQKVKVRYSRKRLKELSGLFMGQSIQAHEGSILAMKFSLDGHYLATAGEDKIVRIWEVVEDEIANEIDIPEIDPSCIYFKVNHKAEVAPLVSDKDTKLNGFKKTADSACIMLPPKVFRIIETPLHVFQGHTGEILDISWSVNNCLLSSSVDKTVRLWRVGCNECLKVYPHNNYVTCVQFNPVNDDYFMSGSIDGKVRIWGINDCQVVDWVDLREIVTAVSYTPDGKGGIAGSVTGICRFFNVSGNHMQVESQVCLHSKKKSTGKRITGFKFFPQDSSKVMVTSADSQVRILSEGNVITKYKGPRNGGNYNSATFTSNGKYMVSASEDNNVYIWNCNNLKEEECTTPSKSIKSFECFSGDACIAIPWSGRNTSELNMRETLSSFSMGNDFSLEAIPKGTATWPEEKLPPSSIRPLSSAMCKSQYNFFRSCCQNMSSSDTWGLVIVTAGWDGRIRSFHNYGLPITL